MKEEVKEEAEEMVETVRQEVMVAAVETSVVEEDSEAATENIVITKTKNGRSGKVR